MDSPGLRQALLEWVRIFMRRSMREFVGWINRSDLSSSQIGALMRVYHRGECPISDIGEDLGLTPDAASQMVDRLVQLGLAGRATRHPGRGPPRHQREPAPAYPGGLAGGGGRPGSGERSPARLRPG